VTNLAGDDRFRRLLTPALSPFGRGGSQWSHRDKASHWVAIGLLLAGLAVLTVYPLAMLLYGSLHSTPLGAGGVFNLNGYRAFFNRETALVLANTVGIPAGSPRPLNARSAGPTRRRQRAVLVLTIFAGMAEFLLRAGKIRASAAMPLFGVSAWCASGECECFWTLELNLHEGHRRSRTVHDVVLDAGGAAVGLAR
jgi:hypothetical protein